MQKSKNMYYFFTDRMDRTSENNRVIFNIDNGLDQDLINYCSSICKKECDATFDPYCGDCHVTRLYYAVKQLAEYEDTRLTPDEVKELKKLRK